MGSVQADRLLEKIGKRVAKAIANQGRVSYVVGYTQNYALPVHEKLDVYHPVGKAQYLIDPFRDMKKMAGKLIAAYMKQGKTINEALLLVALEVQAQSQEEVPVDTGALKNSAFTREETV